MPESKGPRVSSGKNAEKEQAQKGQPESQEESQERSRAAELVARGEQAAEADRKREEISRSREMRASREHDSRVDELSEERATHPERPESPWVRPSSLLAPDPRPGMVQRWIRITVRGADDPRNVSGKMREGWKPRAIDTIPEEFTLTASRTDAQAGYLVVDDLMLCEMPRSKYEQRKRYFREMSERQMQAVEYDLENTQVSGHPIDRKHTSKVTHPPRVLGRRVEAADD